MVNLPVLVLNQNYEPLNVCRVRRALVLLFRGKAEILENGRGVLHSNRDLFSIPSVIRLACAVRRPRLRRKLTKFEVFNRDRYTCQYCGLETRELTIDHVVPRQRGGGHTWDNIVAACTACNRHKASHTPAEAGLKLMRLPKAPQDGTFHIPYHQLRKHTEWHKYLPQQVQAS